MCIMERLNPSSNVYKGKKTLLIKQNTTDKTLQWCQYSEGKKE